MLYLDNKNILEYAQILVTGRKFMNFDIESRSIALASIAQHFLTQTGDSLKILVSCNTLVLSKSMKDCISSFRW